MLNPQAKAAAATEEPDGRSVSELVLDGRHWRCVAGTSGHPGRFRRRGSLLVLHGDGHQGASSQEVRIDGPPIWGMLVYLSGHTDFACAYIIKGAWSPSENVQ